MIKNYQIKRKIQNYIKLSNVINVNNILMNKVPFKLILNQLQRHEILTM